MGFKLGLPIGLGAAAAVFFFMWRAEVNAHRASLAEAETEKALSIAAAEQTTRQALSEAHRRELENRDALVRQAENARNALQAAVDGLETDVADQAEVITRLEFEADLDEIPDFFDCSIVFVPSRVLYAEDCGKADPGADFDYRVCVGPEGINPVDPAFTNITVGDAFRHWQRDRAGLGQCNAQLTAIESLGVPE